MRGTLSFRREFKNQEDREAESRREREEEREWPGPSPIRALDERPRFRRPKQASKAAGRSRCLRTGRGVPDPFSPDCACPAIKLYICSFPCQGLRRSEREFLRCARHLYCIVPDRP